MYALHPGSLPPREPLGKTRIPVTADDLVRLYGLKAWEYIVWDPTDHYEWFDFIHLYPSYYGRYTLIDGYPSKDIPCGSKSSTTSAGGKSRAMTAGTSTRGKSGGR